MSNKPFLKKSNTFFISEPTPEEETPKTIKKSVTVALDESEISENPLENPRPKLKRALTVRSTTFETHQSFLKRKVVYAVLIGLLMVMERLWIKNLRPDEDIAVQAFQNAFGITYQSNTWYIQPFLFLENGLNFYIVMMHIFLIIYYYVSPIIGLKIIKVTLNFAIIICILEIVYGAPRPFWDTTAIVGARCESSYAFPSVNIFSTLFVFRYTNFCLRDIGEKTNREWTVKNIIKYTVFGIFLILFCLFRIVGGVAYISQTLFSLAYATLAYYIATFYDKEIDSLVEKSSIDVQAAKRYTIYWLLYLGIVGAFSIFFYEGANPYIQNDWVGNFIQCLQNYNQTILIQWRSPFHLVGPWVSFVKTIVVVIIFSVIFGTAKTFRDFRGVIWYAVEPIKRLKMTIIANLCLIPTWVFLMLQDTVLDEFMSEWLNRYFINVIHFFIVFYVIFGVLPKYVFERLDLVKRDSGSFMSQSGYMDKNMNTLL